MEGLAPDDLARPDAQDNITDWALGEFQTRYGDHSITKDDIWFYIYGVMHAPDWRQRYTSDLQKSLPRLPMAEDFRAFRDAGEELMALHVNFESCPELEEVVCEVNGNVSEGDHFDPEVYRIREKMRWGKFQLPGLASPDEDTKSSKPPPKSDKTRLVINEQCELTNIPLEAHEYKVSGRSPLEWAADSLVHKFDKDSGIRDDPNGWDLWADDSFELIRHLRRLAYIGVRSAEIIASLPSSLEGCKLLNADPVGQTDGQ